MATDSKPKKNGVSEHHKKDRPAPAGDKFRKFPDRSKDNAAPEVGSKRRLFAKDKSEEQGSSSSSEDDEDGGVDLRPVKRAKADGETTTLRTVVKPGEPGLNSRESHAKQKQLAQERKAAKPLADELIRSKKLWERLRRKSHVPVDERKKLVTELFEIITGRVKDFVLKHDSVRVVQTALKYAVADQRKQIAKELSGTFVQLAENRYAKFLIGKMLVRNDAEIRDIIIPEFFGKVRRLINHPEASWILDDIYRGVATSGQKAVMLREWYGPQFSMFRTDSSTEKVTADLSKILEDEPEKRQLILKHLLEMINQLVQKQMTGFTMLHDAMLQYFRNTKADSEERTEFIQIIKEDESGDLLRNMAFTKSGTRLSCLLLAHGAAKDRKQYMKVYKNTFALMAGDQYGHAIILTAYDVIDDTVLTAKAIFPEILGKLDDEPSSANSLFCANDPCGRVTVRYLFEGLSQSLFTTVYTNDAELLAEVHEIRKTTSKKDVDTRRKELVAQLSPVLLKNIASETTAQQLVTTSFGCQLITEVLLDAPGDKAEALQAVANTALSSLPPIPAEAIPSRARMYKSLIQGGRYSKTTKGIEKHENSPKGFARMLYGAVRDDVVEWATGPDSFVVLALLEADDDEEFEKGKAELVKTLKANQKALKKARDEPRKVEPGKEEASKQQDGAAVAAKKNKNKKAAPKSQPVGNVGAKLLLEKIGA